MANHETNENTGYSLSRRWFDFAFENQDKVTGNHTAMMAWFIELNNRMAWVECFGAPRGDTMSASGIKSNTTYKKVFADLVLWGFVRIVKESKNQYTANIIALPKNGKATYKALAKAIAKQVQSNHHGSVTINKPINLEPLNNLVEVVECACEDVEVSEKRKKVFDDAVASMVEEDWQNKPFDAPDPKGKEKGCGEKESEFVVPERKPLPELAEAMAKVAETAHWRNVLSHHKIDAERRDELFKVFYEQKEDNFKIRLPTWLDMASNFYFWVQISVRNDVKEIKQLVNGASGSKAPRNKVDMAQQRAAKIMQNANLRMPNDGKN